jgi:hypothetical protein
MVIEKLIGHDQSRTSDKIYVINTMIFTCATLTRDVVSHDFPPSVQSYVHRKGGNRRVVRKGKTVPFLTNA